jgi:hypothetical protein
MSFYCLLCIPLVFFLRQASPPGKRHGLWALPLGCLALLVQYFLGPIIVPDGFGFSRWMSGFIDIISLPALIPFIACIVLVLLKVVPVTADYAGFSLLWLASHAVIRSIGGASSPSPISLVLVPTLWAAQAAGISFFADCIKRKPHMGLIFLSVMGIAALPIAATTSWWAFFNQQPFLGYFFLVISLFPATIHLFKVRN